MLLAEAWRYTMDDDNGMQRIENALQRMNSKLISMERKIDMILYEEEYEEAGINVDNDPENEIKRFGQKMPYNRLDGIEQVERFRSFLHYVRMHESKFTPQEFKFAGYADKTFEDVRISDNSRRILGTAYAKAYKRDFEVDFKFVRGFMYKYNNQIVWEWPDGRD